MIKTTRDFFLDIDSYEFNKYRQYVTGDVVLTHKIKEEDRVVTCLSDGLGSGIKASVLANLTATMALKYISNYADVSETAEVIMETLPVCKIRKISYSTFTIIDINGSGHARVIEHGNPDYILLRGTEVVEVHRSPLQLKKWSDREVQLSEFDFHIGDRLIYFSDGVSQAGMGLPDYPLGWGLKDVIRHIQQWIGWEKAISSHGLARKIAMHARKIDSFEPKDDITCGVIYLATSTLPAGCNRAALFGVQRPGTGCNGEVFQRTKSDLRGHNRPDCQPRTRPRGRNGPGQSRSGNSSALKNGRDRSRNRRYAHSQQGGRNSGEQPEA